MPEHYPPPDTKSFQMKAEQYRVRAEELSAISSQFHDGKTRMTLENLATEYLRMAEQMDSLGEIERRLGSRKGGV
jgi:hypothetical protein